MEFWWDAVRSLNLLSTGFQGKLRFKPTVPYKISVNAIRNCLFQGRFYMQLLPHFVKKRASLPPALIVDY